MAAVDYFITGDHEAARGLLAQIMQGQGFEVTASPLGGWNVTRGSVGATVWLGAFAGRDKQRLEYTMQFFDSDGMLVARLARTSGAGALGGAIGVSRSASVFTELDQAIGQDLTNRGLLANALHHP
ncbi:MULTISPECIES: hypothetical protein [Subtercola]|uniref:Uncharacterized protein n=1 Tax=Subtercola vilae TaxID=2056433 RepID=A0A4T2BRX9_9MICO|nr:MULTISPECIES: hypothetical protein [Subtercola]MEA9985852.1 hypothetical protein [Subtercola sp. RTI3]TIH32296.1 hypothetical protein D4765_15770 [Subtercola vilae]